MASHRIDLERNRRGFGGYTMLYDGVLIGKSEQPIYAAARWLLANGAKPLDTVETWRKGQISMKSTVGEAAKWTVTETQSGKPSLYLRRYEAYSGPRVGSQTAETDDRATVVAEHEMECS